jgi:hypothetical protein
MIWRIPRTRCPPAGPTDHWPANGAACGWTHPVGGADGWATKHAAQRRPRAKSPGRECAANRRRTPPYSAWARRGRVGASPPKSQRRIWRRGKTMATALLCREEVDGVLIYGLWEALRRHKDHATGQASGRSHAAVPPQAPPPQPTQRRSSPQASCSPRGRACKGHPYARLNPKGRACPHHSVLGKERRPMGLKRNSSLTRHPLRNLLIW